MTTEPNTFLFHAYQTPNTYVDQLMSYLTDAEWKVLSYAARRIFGFNKRQDRIALSQFVTGLKDKDGNPLDRGTGMNKDTVKNALKHLVAFKVLIQVAENDPHRNEGPLYELQVDSREVDWQALVDRWETNQRAQQARTEKARAARKVPPISRGSTDTQPTPDPLLSHKGGSVGQVDPPTCPTSPPPPLSDKLHNNQGKTEKNSVPRAERTPPLLFEIAQALASVTGIDFSKNKGRLFKEAKFYQPEDVPQIQADYGAQGLWYQSWRGQDGEPPTLGQIRETWNNLTPAPPKNTRNATPPQPPRTARVWADGTPVQ